jgi:PAS domain S-box-containing protein
MTLSPPLDAPRSDVNLEAHTQIIEQRLRENEERLRLAIEHADIGFWDVDVLKDELIWPPLVKGLFGISPDVPVSMTDFYVGLHPDDRDATVAAFNAAVDPEQRALYDVEYRTVGKEDGAIRWVGAKGRGIFDENGRCIRVVGTAIDITRRKAVDQELRDLNANLESRVAQALAERQLFASVVEGATAAIMVCDPGFRILAINPANVDEFERVFGKRPKAGDNLLDLVAYLPHERERVYQAWSPALAGEEYVITDEFGDDDLERVAFEIRFQSLRDKDGKLLGAVQTAYDVSEKVRAQAMLAKAEEARREADALYRAYFENTPEALFVIGVQPDDTFVVEELNPAHQSALGFPIEEVRGRRVEEFLASEVADSVLRTYRQVVATGQTRQWREAYELNGQTQHWDSALFPVRDSSGQITRLIGSSRNVTRQVVAEESLRQSQKMEAVGQLTGGIAHDFNNLLNAVMGAFDLIRRKPDNLERVKKYAQAGLEAAERGAKLTGQLLAFSRAQRIEMKPLKVTELIDGMRDLLASTLGPMVQLRFDLPEQNPAVLSDSTQLEMAVLNMAINARDAMSQGGELSIRSRRYQTDGDGELQAGEYIELSVSDTGIGMDSDVAARALDPFFTTKGVGKGTGLGLSQVYGIARQSGGTVRIESKLGVGTTVRIYLPVTDVEPGIMEPSEASIVAGAQLSATVLVVDDDPDVRQLLAASLEALGYQAREAPDGQSGLAALEVSRPDLLVLDFAMPGMNGADVAALARQRYPQLPIIFASGYSDTAAIEAAVGPSVIILRKPFRMDELQTVVAAVLAEAARRETPATSTRQ